MVGTYSGTGPLARRESAMNTIKLIIGFTKSDRFGTGYIAPMDGYRVGAEQETVELDYPDYIESVWDVAERVFIATNAPLEVIDRVGSQRALYDMLQATGKPLRALSVGDTVTYDGQTLACERTGWRDVTVELTEYQFGLGAALAAEADATTERA